MDFIWYTFLWEAVLSLKKWPGFTDINYGIIFFPIRNRNTMKKYSDLGVATKETPFEVAEASDVVITMLPSPSHVSRDRLFPVSSWRGLFCYLDCVFIYVDAVTCMFYDLTFIVILLHSSWNFTSHERSIYFEIWHDNLY